ncbi:lysine--tRNA ligase [Asticcacaulis sp. EMRT-3]|uniref:lysine--tRNA ligase n=1 Tax=Asticcacaulis sp. EMRT-3 TaxID=3040349 RepID=UPI0024AF2214|nr:lysine--tRNA ligase [Asticcacaulis sp. EMRT-3]MDI7774434.1 lysine--tRNA ligase [Asticcacaulis sp. EMRT-3]
MTSLSTLAYAGRAWPFEQARALIARLVKTRIQGHEAQKQALALISDGKTAEALKAFEGLDRAVIFETGYGPSGLPHIGTFGEVARTTMVRQAFEAMTGGAWATRLICFSDDMDGLRKVPDGIPNAQVLHEDLYKPLTVVRDPFGAYPSFGQHNNARLKNFLDGFGFAYEFLSATDCYKGGVFDATLLIALERFDDIQKIMLPTLGPDRRATYSPFLPISPKTGHVLQVPTLERNVAWGTIVFEENGEKFEVPVTGGHVKMQWKPDWAMRWAALGVDYEMAGKDLIDSVKVSSQVCRVLGGASPEGFNYELFLDEQGQKISKSKGNGLTMEDWLRYGAPESLAYYMFQSPKSAKKLYFDVIPRATDEYFQQLDAFPKQELDKRIENPVWFVLRGQEAPKSPPVTFGLMLNLVSAANAADKETLWGFLRAYIPGATPESEPVLDRLAGYALNYFEDFVKPAKTFRLPDDRERAAMSDLAARFRALPSDTRDAEVLQNLVFEVGKAHEFEPLRAWFQALYEVLLGQSQGPRFGSFVAIFGLERTVALIERGLAGELAGT